eukprot:jgi/Botrbrau1/19273/Bobra.0073s0021.2
MVDCQLNTTAPPGEVGGFLTEVADLMFARVGWREEDYVYTCMDWNAMVADLEDDNGTCYMSAAGIPVTTDEASKGIKFSWTMYRNFLSILIYVPETTYNTWTFLTPFTWDLWLALALTAVGVGFIVWLAEWASTKRAAHGSPFSELSLEGLSYSTWQSTGKLVQGTQELDGVNTLAARVIVWTYSLLIMVAIATYTGKTAATLTSTSINTNIHGIADLRGKAVATWDGYKDIFDGIKGLKYPFRPVYMAWNNKVDEQLLLDTLRSEKITALVIDIVFTQSKASAACDLHVVGEKFEPSDLALAFPKGFLDNVAIQRFSYAIKANEEDSLIDPVTQRYFNGSSTCPVRSNDDAPIGFGSMLGLWYIMGASFLFALFAIAASHISWATGTTARLQRSTHHVLSRARSASGRLSNSMSHSFQRSHTRFTFMRGPTAVAEDVEEYASDSEGGNLPAEDVHDAPAITDLGDPIWKDVEDPCEAGCVARGTASGERPERHPAVGTGPGERGPISAAAARNKGVSGRGGEPRQFAAAAEDGLAGQGGRKEGNITSRGDGSGNRSSAGDEEGTSPEVWGGVDGLGMVHALSGGEGGGSFRRRRFLEQQPGGSPRGSGSQGGAHGSIASGRCSDGGTGSHFPCPVSEEDGWLEGPAADGWMKGEKSDAYKSEDGALHQDGETPEEWEQRLADVIQRVMARARRQLQARVAIILETAQQSQLQEE